MNRGDIPGYYYDEEKKKYFKIQANHIAPENAKYNKTNAKIEQRKNKKRKREEKRQIIVRKQTVVTPRLLKHPLISGAGLQREIASKPSATHSVQGDAAFVHGLELNETCLEFQGHNPTLTRLTDAYYLPDQSQILLAVRHNVGSHVVYSYDYNDDWGTKNTLQERRPLCAFYEPINSLQTAIIDEVPYVMVSAAKSNRFSGNICFGPLYDSDVAHNVYHGNIGEDGDLTWDCKLHDVRKDLVAVVGTFGVVVFSLGNGASTITNPNIVEEGETFAVDWIDSNLFAVGTKHSRHNRNPETPYSVVLWDLRSQDGAVRIQRLDKIKGVHRVDRTGHQLVVTSSHDINLYDLRFVSRRQPLPLLSFDHKSGSPHVDVSILNDNLLAASDRNNKMQVYSLREGKHLRELKTCGGRNDLLSKPRWQEDFRGVPYLQSCLDTTIQRWS